MTITAGAPLAEAPAAQAARTPWARKALPWALTAVLLAGAWVVNAVALPDSASEAPFVSAATVGGTATAGNLTAKVIGVHAARSINDPSGWTAEGTWLVVELDAEAVDSQYGSMLSVAELTIGDRTFRATERGQTMFRTGALVPGVMRHGALAFELPEDALKGTAALRLANASTVADNGVIELPIDLGGIPIEDDITLPETGWAG
ncbi:hypothetical protein [uncultured Microbacterium sp.]|uniref:hypothetical protein n=1 Tax=uncultured Microbacterium sp. TaxID=191216 RepID=UPI00262A0670|nr:hypothetical protein [uncultured Microbacterium sp.]